MKTWLVMAVLAAVSASGYAQEKTAASRSMPFEGEVSTEKLSVRMFPKGDANSIVTSYLTLGEKVVVVGELKVDQVEYFQIKPPHGSTVWVSAKSVKKDGAVAQAIVSDVPVRLDSRVNADQVATLKEGEAVKVVAEHMGWYKIESPDSVKYFVGRKYVKASAGVVAAVQPRAADEPAKRAARAEPRVEDSDAEAKKELAIAESLLDEQKRLIDAKQMRQVDFTEAVRHFETARSIARTEPVRAEADRGLKRYKDIAVLWQATKAQIEAAEERVAADRKAAAEKPVDVQKGYTMTGFIDTTGLLWKRPGTHKLVMGGKIVCFLRVKEGDERMIGRLNDCYQKYVGVNGTVIRNPDGWDGYSVIVVEEVAPVQEPK
jgi:SH3-like domain-containing protein